MFLVRNAINTISIIIIFLSILFGVGYTYVRAKIYSPIEEKDSILYQANELSNENEEIKKQGDITKVNEESTVKNRKEIINILLIGSDARNENEVARSDSLIIATIDKNKEKIKFTSLMRDSYVSIKGHGEDKINSAFAYGGVPLLFDTINRNFGLKLDKYISINFWGFEKVIDRLGGIYIEIKPYEVNEINKFIGENDQIKSPKLKKSGYQKLDGQQALAYSRIRKVGNGTYERDQRQRLVMNEICKKVTQLTPTQCTILMNSILPYIKTNIEPATLLNYALDILTFNNIQTEGLQIPLTELCSGQMYYGKWVFLLDKTQNAMALQEFIYNDRKITKSDINESKFKEVLEQYMLKEKNHKIK